MPKKIPVGVDNFGKLVKGDYLFCDKTLMIKDLIEKGDEVTLFTRPRRWGKTLNMSMFHYFFAPQVNGESTEGLFNNLKIAQEEGEYIAKYQGKTPVMFITFKDINEMTYSSALAKTQELIGRLYDEFSTELMASPKLTALQQDKFKRILMGESSLTELENSLLTLSECLHKHYGQNVYILIDEYDTPLHNAYKNKYLNEMTSFMRNLFSAALKSNPSLGKGILTGVLRVSKDSMLSGLNNLVTYTLLDDHCKQYFGFTEEEVIALFSNQNCPTKIEEVRDWYNGYKSGDLVVYNPWSIVSCLGRKGELDVYWVNTARNDLIGETITESTVDIKRKLQLLMKGETIETTIDKHTTFDMLEGNEKALWSLLLFAGYLKAESSEREEEKIGYKCRLKIPNKEVMLLYNDYVIGWFSKKLGRVSYKTFLEHLTDGNVDLFTEDLSGYLLESASFHDVSGDKKSEQFYHGFVFALIAGLRDSYAIRSNRESGLGRYDLLLIPKAANNSLGIILEFKHAKEKENVRQVAEIALKQINQNLYETELKTHAHIKEVLKIGVAFSGKSAISAYEKTDILSHHDGGIKLTRLLGTDGDAALESGDWQT